jgi:hypothetical protein
MRRPFFGQPCDRGEIGPIQRRDPQVAGEDFAELGGTVQNSALFAAIAPTEREPVIEERIMACGIGASGEQVVRE